MTIKEPADNVIRFPVESVARFGFRRVKRRPPTESRMEREGQLNLFEKPAGEVVPFPAAHGLFDQALMLDDAGESRAAQAYREAIDAGDCVADAYCNLGVIETGLGNREAAFDCFKAALKHDPRHFESHYNVGNLYFENGELRPARLHYEIAAELDPDCTNVYFNLGVVDAMNGDFRGALDALEKYKSLAPVEEGGKADELIAQLRRSVPHHT